MKLALYIEERDNQLLAEVLRMACPKLGLTITSTAADANVVITDKPKNLWKNLKDKKEVVQLHKGEPTAIFHDSFKQYASHLRVFNLAPNHGGAEGLANYLRQLATLEERIRAEQLSERTFN